MTSTRLQLSIDLERILITLSLQARVVGALGLESFHREEAHLLAPDHRLKHDCGFRPSYRLGTTGDDSHHRPELVDCLSK